ncbi:MAG: hypothetical protein EOO77_38765, partial [Oxalobacteraceae bacterium]
MRQSHVLLAALAMSLSGISTAANANGPEPGFVEKSKVLKDKVLADPASALSEIASARREQVADKDAASVAMRAAMLDWLEGEAYLRLNDLGRAQPLINRGLATTRRYGRNSR